MSHKRQSPTRRRPAGELELRRSPEEWIGGRLTGPAYVAEDVPMRPDLVIRICGEDILRVELVRPEAPAGVVGEQLREAMRSPMVGKPRRPQRIRVADPSLVQAIRLVVDKATPIEVGPTPELARLSQTLTCYLYDSAPAQQPSYLQHGRISAETMGGFFRAAAALFHEQPWKIIPTDSDLLLLDIPALGLSERCASIIGQMGESFGFLLFDSVEGHRSMQTAGLTIQTTGAAPHDLGTPIFSVNYERGADIPTFMRREIVRHDWEVASTSGYPHIVLVDADHVERPYSEQDVVRAWGAASALLRFLRQHRAALRCGDGVPGRASPALPSLESRFVLDDVPGAPEARVVSPHPDAEALAADDMDEDWEYGLAVVETFLKSEAEAGKADEWLGRARAVCESLLEYKLDHLLEEVGGWTAAQVESFLLDYFPSEVVVEGHVVAQVPEILRTFFAYLLELGFLTERSAAAIDKRIAARQQAFLRRVQDPGRFGLAKSLMTELRRQGVDLTDVAAMQAFLHQHVEALHGAGAAPFGPPRRRR